MDRKSPNRNHRTGIETCSIVADILRDWPATAPVFVKRRLGCVGCQMSVFDTIADVARIYNFDAGYFLNELRNAIQAGDPGIDQQA